jgi:D-alanine--poly(phosphoribitol) ligase subunit 1
MNTILEQFERTAEAFPDEIAVEEGVSHLTWKKLKERAQRSGSALAAVGCRKKPVVLMLEKSCDALALLYGVLYSGGFYVFVDTAQPDERIKKILNKLDAEVVVSEADQEGRLLAMGYHGTVLDAKKILRADIDREALSKIRDAADAEDLLYAVFTSGSTGEPKGIAVSHDAAAKFIGHFVKAFNITRKDILGNQAPFDFDVSVKDIFSSCMTGARLVLVPRTYFAMPRQLIDYLCEKKVTTLIWAVSALCMISQFGGLDYRVPVNLHKVMFSGETMPLAQLKIWQDALPGTQFVNLYGPSEITCNCTYYLVPDHFSGIVLPIGKAFQGRRVFLLDDNHEEIHSANSPGEICVSGESLAEGYYHDPEKTAQAFVIRDGERIYRTGDIGYYGKDGLLNFVGRRDFQIKHMGHRIELGEVENAMEQIPGVGRACCIFNHADNLVYGFYQGESAASQVRRELKQKLPSYMVPNKLKKVDTFALSTHGKIDRNALRAAAGL